MENEIKNVINWLEASKEDFVGETKTNASFLIERLKKVIGSELSEDDAMEREHEPVEYYSEPELPSEHNL